jgi:hypothetical protein
MSSFSMIRRVALAGLLALGLAGPVMASDGSDTSEETTPRSETTPTVSTTTVVVVPAQQAQQQAQLEAARARCDDLRDRAAFLARTGGPVEKGGEIDRVKAQAYACQAEIDAAVLAASTPTQPVYLPQ